MISIANELVKNGHKVTLVTPWKSLKPDPSVNHIVVESDFPKHNEERSRTALGSVRNLGPLDLLKLINISVMTNSNAIKQLKHLVDSKIQIQHIDWSNLQQRFF